MGLFKYICVFTVAITLMGCEREDKTTTTILDDPNSLQAMSEARTARESLPGKVHYDKFCASCHNGNLKKAPHRSMIGLLTPESILGTIETGIMKNEAINLTREEKIEVAEYLSGAEFGKETSRIASCTETKKYQPDLTDSGKNWGFQLENTREISAAVGGISSENIRSLNTKWAIAMPGSTRVRSQPLFAGGLIYVGSHSGLVYALDEETGCEVWSFRASGEVRTGITINDAGVLFFGDVLANVYGVNAQTGALQWRIRADDHPSATITGTPTPYNGNLYIPVSTLENGLAIDPNYECCSFRGSVLSVNGNTGELNWKTYTIENPPAISGQNPVGTNILGPSGAVVWNSPSIDVTNNQLYVGTGENMSSPASMTSDALLAIDLDTGEINWVFQATANDVWNGSCDTTTPQNCPIEDGPDFDFGGATLIIETTQHGRLVVAGQKSGFVHAVKPETGELVWQKRVGRGGIQGGIHFGIAAKGETLLIPMSDMADGRTYPTPALPGMHALDANTGEILWSAVSEDRCDGRKGCHPGISQAVTVVGDLVIGGAMDGVVRAYRIDSGKVVWSLDSTTSEYPSLTGHVATGGSFGGAAGPVAFDGTLLLSSGYGLYNHMAGNLLLALEIK